jgi:hypothetical protein
MSHISASSSQNRHVPGLLRPVGGAISGKDDGSRASERSSQMATSPAQPQQGGSSGQTQQQQGQQSGGAPQQAGQPIFRDWAAI